MAYHISFLARWNRDREEASITHDRKSNIRCYSAMERNNLNTLMKQVYGRELLPGRTCGKYTGKAKDKNTKLFMTLHGTRDIKKVLELLCFKTKTISSCMFEYHKFY